MRWDRPTLKQRAKNELRFSYGKSLGAIGIVLAISYAVMMLVAVISMVAIVGVVFSQMFASGGNLTDAEGIELAVRTLLIAGSMLVIAVPLGIFVFGPLYVGVYKFSLEAPRGDRRVGNVFAPMKKGNYGAAMKGMFLRTLFMFLPMLAPLVLNAVLVVSLIVGNGVGVAMWIQTLVSAIVYIAAYAAVLVLNYRWCLVPFVVADDPSVTGIEALRRSAALTKGQRWELFVLDLSFLGWFALGALCFGIGVYFVMPYYLATWAQLFFALKGELPEQTMAQRLPPYDPAGFYGQTPQQPQPYAPYPGAAQQASQPYTPSYATPPTPPQAPESAGPLYPDLRGGIDRE